MSSDEDRMRARLLEEILDKLMRSRDLRRPIALFTPELPEKKEETFDLNEQVLRLSSELEDLRSQFNRYLKVEAREESGNQFRELISKIDEISELYVEHTTNGIVFWIFYDRGDRIAVLEKVVDAEFDLEEVFKSLDFDYRLLPRSSMNSRVTSKAELIFKR